MRSRDWSATPVGPVESWSYGLKTAIRLILHSPSPMCIWWGQPLTNFYNDAYSSLLGQRHPEALGQSASEVWAEVWESVGLEAEAVLHQGKAFTSEMRLVIERDGYREEAYFTFSYSPVPADAGGFGGVFCTVTEDTEQVVSDRRLRTLRELGTEVIAAKTAEAVCELSAGRLTHNSYDIPFALFYLLNHSHSQARLVGTTRLAAGTIASPKVIELPPAALSNRWKLGQVIQTGKSKTIDDLEARFGQLPGGASSEAPQQAVVLPLGARELFGFLVVGVSPLRRFDERYKVFLDLVAGQVASAISNARVSAEEALQQAHDELKQQANQLVEVNRALQNALEEIQVTEEEVRQQNEELIIARELAELEGHRYQDLFNFAPDGYVVTDANGMIQEANQAIADLVAIEQSYLVNTPFVVYIANSDRRAFRNLHYELQLQSLAGKLQTDELKLKPAKGQLIPVAITGTAIRNAQAQVIGVRWLVRDITARKQAEATRLRLSEEREQLLQREQAARVAAEEANRLKDEFLAVLSHELRSPLNPILGWARLLQAGKLDEATTRQALTTIERNAKLQSELIEDLLDVSRILQGKLSLTVSPVNLAAIIRAAIETVRLAAEAKSIRVETSLDEARSVSGDATRLQQVVWNLLSNAVKFTPIGGRVEVRLEQVGNQAQITISDNGKGISIEFLPYVFDYFRQGDGATTRKFGGLGLGLSIVRHLVELHGGTVQADSPGEGQGASFTVRLPLLAMQADTEQQEQSSEALLNLQGVRILVVDDDVDTRELIVFLLQEYGADVISASSASDVLKALTQSKPDVFVSDIGMPDTDGYMLIQQIRALSPEQGGQIPAIALTAYAGEFNQQQALQAGFQKHLSKPIEPDELIRAVATLIGN
ncbi:response regulator [Phormidium tenue FACHB-886]|nr:response regulator [Phormidium tenue FACHB-886]